jgi:hypothetical protein
MLGMERAPGAIVAASISPNEMAPILANASPMVGKSLLGSRLGLTIRAGGGGRFLLFSWGKNLMVRAAFFGLTVVLLGSTAAMAVEAVWIGPDVGQWNVAANWSTGAVPNSGMSVRIDDDPSRDSRVESTTTASVGLLAIDEGDSLAILNSQMFVSQPVLLDGAVIVTNGQFNVNNLLLLNEDSEARLTSSNAVASPGTLANLGGLIHGGGRLNINGNSLTQNINLSTIQADHPTIPLTVVVGSSTSLTNLGRLIASGGGRLQIQGQFMQFANPVSIVGGRIEAHPGSVVALQQYSYVKDAVLALIEDEDPLTSAPRFEFTGGKLENVALEGLIKISGATFLGTLENRGVVTFGTAQGQPSSHAWLGGQLLLTGGGTVQLDGSTTIGLFWSGGTGGTDRLINVDNVVRGRGELAVSWLPITNRGVIQADEAPAGPVGEMVFYNGTSNAPLINSGAMKAINGGRLRIGYGSSQPNYVQNYEGDDPGEIIAGEGSQVRLAYTTIVGGVLRAEGDDPATRGKFIFDNNVTLENSAFEGFIRAQTDANSLPTVFLKGQINNKGTLNARIQASAPVEFTGGGEILLETVTGGSSLQAASSIINVDNVIHGNGTIGSGGSSTLTNRGTIRSDGLLQMNNGLPIINSGRIEAAPGTELVAPIAPMIQNHEDGVPGVIHAADGGIVRIGGYCCGGVNGGILSTEGSGVIRLIEDSILKDVHNTGNVEFNYIFGQGTIVNDGVIRGRMRMTSSLFRIDGSGQWETTGSWLEGSLFINGPEHTIVGSGGLFGLTGTVAVVVNEGTIRATEGPFNISAVSASNSGMLHAPIDRALNISTTSGRVENTGTFLAEGTIGVYSSAGLHNFDEGLIDVRGVLTLEQTVLRNRPDGMIVGTGEIAGSVATGPLVLNEGVVEPGAGLATLQIGDDFQQLSSGQLQMEIAGGEAPSNDLLAVAGLATLAGTLVATLVGEESLAPNDSFTLLTATGGIAGAFDQWVLPDLPDDQFWFIEYDTNQVRATVEEIIPGDFNLDGTVDAADYVAWIKTGGNETQLGEWRSNFGSSVANEPPPASAAVPEPATWWMLLCATAVAFRLKLQNGSRPR